MIQTLIAPFVLQALPYTHNVLIPHISNKILYVHHGKHHQAYVNKLNELVSSSEFASENFDTKSL